MNYYSILQVDENTTQEEIKQAYHEMTRLFHPDNFHGPQKDAEEQMTKINEAYVILRDENKRAVYDTSRKLNGKVKYDTGKRDNTEESETQQKTKHTNTMLQQEDTKKDVFSSCLSKIIEWAIYIGIIYGLLSRFNIIERVDNFFSSNHNLSTIMNETGFVSLEPDEIVDSYFTYVRNGKDEKASNLFTEDCDFQNSTVEGFHHIITELYYGFETDIPMYPLFEEIRNFNYQIVASQIDENEEYAEVLIYIQNCDVALIFGALLEMNDGSDYLESLSDKEFQEVFRALIKEYKDVCMIDTTATFTLKNTKEDGWKIQSISPLKEFSTIMVGQADAMILAVNGEEIDSDYYEDFNSHMEIGQSDLQIFETENTSLDNNTQLENVTMNVSHKNISLNGNSQKCYVTIDGMSNSDIDRNFYCKSLNENIVDVEVEEQNGNRVTLLLHPVGEGTAKIYIALCNTILEDWIFVNNYTEFEDKIEENTSIDVPDEEMKENINNSIYGEENKNIGIYDEIEDTENFMDINMSESVTVKNVNIEVSKSEIIFENKASQTVYVTFENAPKDEFICTLGDDSVADIQLGNWKGDTIAIVITPEENGETRLEVGQKNSDNYEIISITTVLPRMEMEDVYVNGNDESCYLQVFNFSTNSTPNVFIKDESMVGYELRGWVAEDLYEIVFYPLQEGVTTATISLDGIEEDLTIDIESNIFEMYVEEDEYVLNVGEYRFITLKLCDYELESMSFTCKSEDERIATCVSEHQYGDEVYFTIYAHNSGNTKIEIFANSCCSVSFDVVVE